MNKIFCLLIVIFLIPIVDAVKLGASNSNINFSMEVNDKECNRVEIGTDYYGNIIGELKFAKTNSPNIKNYKFDGNYFKIKTEYEKEINFKKPGNKETEICLTAKNPGNYSGLIIYKTNGKNAAIGIFINIIVKERKIDKNMALLLTPSIFLSVLLILLIKSFKPT